jgi:hypothetical protein
VAKRCSLEQQIIDAQIDRAGAATGPATIVSPCCSEEDVAMIVDRVSYVPCNARRRPMAPHRSNLEIFEPGSSAKDGDADLSAAAIPSPAPPRSWPRLFPGL